MHNILPAEAFNMARETPNFLYYAFFFDFNRKEELDSITTLQKMQQQPKTVKRTEGKKFSSFLNFIF